MKTKGMVIVIALLMLSSIAMASGPHGSNKWDCISGSIVSINTVDMQFVVGNTTVQVDANTVIMKERVPITFGDLVVGMNVRARGVMDKNLLLAKHVTVLCSTSLCIRVEGKIDSIDPKNMTLEVKGVIIQVKKDTVLVMKGTPIDFADLKVGMTVVAVGILDKNILTAKRVNVKYCGR